MKPAVPVWQRYENFSKQCHSPMMFKLLAKGIYTSLTNIDSKGLPVMCAELSFDN